VLAGVSGLRVGEISGPLWSDLDITRGIVTACRTIEQDDDGALLEFPPKNGEARVVPLPAAACDELRIWLAAQKEYRLAQGPACNEAGRVVPKKDGTQIAPSTLTSQ
jgi:integrase